MLSTKLTWLLKVKCDGGAMMSADSTTECSFWLLDENYLWKSSCYSMSDLFVKATFSSILESLSTIVPWMFTLDHIHYSLGYLFTFVIWVHFLKSILISWIISKNRLPLFKHTSAKSISKQSLQVPFEKRLQSHFAFLVKHDHKI